MAAKLIIRPATAERWRDVERLFGPTGACAGCWCMFLRETSAEFERKCARGGADNRESLKALVKSGAEPGLLAYRDGEPVGWVAVARREEYGRVLRSPVHRPIDDESGVWAVTCFFIAEGARGSGVASTLLDAAVAHARGQGAHLVEGYPRDVGGARKPATAMWRGSLTLFRRAGFEEAARRHPSRPILRRYL